SEYCAHLVLYVVGDVYDERGHDEARVGRVCERGHTYSALARLLVVAPHRGEAGRLADDARGVGVVWVRVVPVRREYDFGLVSSDDAHERAASLLGGPDVAVGLL